MTEDLTRVDDEPTGPKVSVRTRCDFRLQSDYVRGDLTGGKLLVDKPDL